MELKTQIKAGEGSQDLLITRDFDLPVELLFRAYIEPEIVEEWMGTKVIKLEARRHGSWQFETKDKSGNVLIRTNGVIHEFIPNEKITRTFEMENTPFPIQLEYLEFDFVTAETSRLSMQIIYKSVESRNEMLKLPFEKGINMAHNRLQEVVSKLK